MIIGHGDIASILNDRKKALFFAAGVSNSQETNEEEYSRERLRLMTFIGISNGLNQSLFYFGTIACYFTVSRYTKHKLEMEQLIRDTCNNYNIIRIGNIDWGKNPNTFLNYIRNKKAAGEHVEIRDEWKYMISQDQLRLLCDHLPTTGKNEISIFGDCKKVKDLI